ncbi:hypothetical protein Mapa_015992 [Marchantia paleacea]|nr:hypothetical protein Mapa_015992 [Marchantia paleacea]
MGVAEEVSEVGGRRVGTGLWRMHLQGWVFYVCCLSIKLTSGVENVSFIPTANVKSGVHFLYTFGFIHTVGIHQLG